MGGHGFKPRDLAHSPAWSLPTAGLQPPTYRAPCPLRGLCDTPRILHTHQSCTGAAAQQGPAADWPHQQMQQCAWGPHESRPLRVQQPLLVDLGEGGFRRQTPFQYAYASLRDTGRLAADLLFAVRVPGAHFFFPKQYQNPEPPPPQNIQGRTCVQHHETARPVGVFGLVLQALLAQHGSVLVSQTACSTQAPVCHRCTGLGAEALKRTDTAHRLTVRMWCLVLSVVPLTGTPMLQRRRCQPANYECKAWAPAKASKQELLRLCTSPASE